MIAYLMLYGIVFSALVALAAQAAEHLALRRGAQTRWIWGAGMVASVGLPAWLTARGPRSTGGGGEVVLGEVGVALPVGAPAMAADVAGTAPVGWVDLAHALDGPLLLLWGVTSAIALSVLAMALLRLRRRSRVWRAERLEGWEVQVSERTGPAVVGVTRSRIVVPRWVRDLPADQRRLVLRHEQAHVRARDPQLVLAAYLLVAAVPWNLPLVWQFRRLRRAVEVDCDARVMAAEADAAAYGSLLIEVSRRSRPVGLAAAAMTEGPGLLEQRIRLLLDRPRRSWTRSAIGAAAVAAMVAACEIDPPAVMAPSASDPAIVPTAEGAELEPSITRFDTPPRLLDRDAVRASIERAFPPALREAGLGGTVALWIYLNAEGGVEQARIVSSSGREALDEAALRVARDMAFSPALDQGVPVPVWIQIPVHFEPATDRVAADMGHARAASLVDDRPVVQVPLTRDRVEATDTVPQPTFTPFDERPMLENRQEFAEALEAAYPPALREAGIGGTVTLWILIDRTGRVTTTHVANPSGHPALDEAAREGITTARFSPARNQGEPVNVWIQIPVTMQPR